MPQRNFQFYFVGLDPFPFSFSVYKLLCPCLFLWPPPHPPSRPPFQYGDFSVREGIKKTEDQKCDLFRSRGEGRGSDFLLLKKTFKVLRKPKKTLCSLLTFLVTVLYCYTLHYIELHSTTLKYMVLEWVTLYYIVLLYKSKYYAVIYCTVQKGMVLGSAVVKKKYILLKTRRGRPRW